MEQAYEPIETQSPEIVCVGQAVVDCIMRGIMADPLGNGKTRADSITLNLGGDALNESFVLAGMGRRAALMCALGEDIAGKSILEEAVRRGVNTDRITLNPALVTPVAGMLVEVDGSRSSISSKASMLPGYVPDPSAFESAAVVSFASLFRAPLDDPDVVRRLIRAAKDAGALVFADTKLPTYRNMAISDIQDVLSMIDCIFPNETEAAFYSGKNEPAEMAAALLDLGLSSVVIKLGPQGIYAADRNEAFAMDALPVPVVDTTGAGDNFVAGFIDARLDGNSFRGCCEAGLRAAAASIQHLGAV